jgi:hypothetical protein
MSGDDMIDMEFVTVWKIDLLYRGACVAWSKVLSRLTTSTASVPMREKAAKQINLLKLTRQ